MVLYISFKKIVIIHIILILLIVTITVRIKIKEDNYDCITCIVAFEERDIFMERTTKTINIPLQELYEGYVNGSCMIEWNEGYIIKGDLNVTFWDGEEDSPLINQRGCQP